MSSPTPRIGRSSSSKVAVAMASVSRDRLEAGFRIELGIRATRGDRRVERAERERQGAQVLLGGSGSAADDARAGEVEIEGMIRPGFGGQRTIGKTRHGGFAGGEQDAGSESGFVERVLRSRELGKSARHARKLEKDGAR